ncbi:MAG: hypothetical protein ACLT8E_04330 [Akkermansia sp.]
MNVTRAVRRAGQGRGETAAQYIADLEGTGIFRRRATAATERTSTA